MLVAGRSTVSTKPLQLSAFVKSREFPLGDELTVSDLFVVIALFGALTTFGYGKFIKNVR